MFRTIINELEPFNRYCNKSLLLHSVKSLWQPLHKKCTQYILFEIHYYTIHIFGFWWSLTGNSIFFSFKSIIFCSIVFVTYIYLYVSLCMNVSRTLNNNLVLCDISKDYYHIHTKMLYKLRIIIITCGHVI